MKRNPALDYLKIVLSILVIAIHITPLAIYDIEHYIRNGIARTAVPVFYIINGYFLYNAIIGNNLRKPLLRIL